MIKICYVTDAKGDLVEVVSDKPIRFFMVGDHCKRDTVYELTANGPVLKIGAQHVRRKLRGHTIGHLHDDWFGAMPGRRKPPIWSARANQRRGRKRCARRRSRSRS